MKRIESELSTAEQQPRPLHESDIAGHDAPGLPEDQMVRLGEDATFTAPEGPEGTTYQWVRQRPGRAEELIGETGRTLTLKETTLKDVGFYRCYVTTPDKEELSKPASLIVSMPTVGDKGVAAVSGSTTPVAAVVAASGSLGACPGSYVGYAYFCKTGAAWGWAPESGVTPRTATDNERSDTKVRYLGKSMGDNGCNQTSVTLPDPPASAKYRFYIYFPTTIPSVDPYPITLSGFEP